jgi:hypothetical protein
MLMLFRQFPKNRNADAEEDVAFTILSGAGFEKTLCVYGGSFIPQYLQLFCDFLCRGHEENT